MSTALRRIPLSKPYIGEREEELVLEVLRSGRLSMGPAIDRFEELIEEAGLRAPAGPAWHARTVWRGDEPGFAITCHVWRVAGTPDPVVTDELDPSWRPLDEVVDDPEALPGVRLVLDDVRHRLDLT